VFGCQPSTKDETPHTYRYSSQPFCARLELHSCSRQSTSSYLAIHSMQRLRWPQFLPLSSRRLKPLFNSFHVRALHAGVSAPTLLSNLETGAPPACTICRDDVASVGGDGFAKHKTYATLTFILSKSTRTVATVRTLGEEAHASHFCSCSPANRIAGAIPFPVRRVLTLFFLL